MKLEAGIGRDAAFELLEQHNKEPFHIEHAETPARCGIYRNDLRLGGPNCASCGDYSTRHPGFHGENITPDEVFTSEIISNSLSPVR